MVCRLCGAANPAQHVSCIACGSSLERVPATGGPHRHVEGRSHRYVWLALCLSLGAVLGLSLVRARASGPPHAYLYLLGVFLGAVGGVALGSLPGPGLAALRRAWAFVVYALFCWRASRMLASIRRRCEETIASGASNPDAQLRLAGALWLEGARGQAEQLLQRLLQASPEASLARHNFAVAQGTAGHQARAVEELERARPHMGDSATCSWNLGLARWNLGQLAEAAEAFRQAEQHNRTDLAARSALALTLARQGELDQATSELERGLSIERRHPDILCNLGVVHQSRGDLEVASHYFTGAIGRQSAHRAARYNRGLCAALQARHRAAVRDFAILLHLDPGHAWALTEKAICHYQLGDSGPALDNIRRAARVGRGDFQVLYNAGTLLLREEIIDQSISHLEKAYELQPGSVNVIINLGVATHLAGHPRKSLDHFRAAVRMNPRHALARYNCAVAYSMADMTEQAEREIEELLSLYPDFPEAFNAIGVIRLQQNRLVEAAGQFRRATDAMPQSAIVRANLAMTYYLEGDLAAAAEQARSAIRLDPQLAAAREIAGRTALEMNALPLAIEHFSALIRLEPANPDAHANLGLAYYKADRLDKSIESYRRVLIFAPNSPEGHNDLGLSYAKNDMLSEAANELNQVIKWRPNNPIAHSNLGLVCYFNEDTEHAVHEWREVTRLSPAYARSREATRFSAYDDQEMTMRPIDRRQRARHFPLKVASFRHSFQLAMDERAYRPVLPWPDLSAAAAILERAHRARAAAL